MEIVICYKYLRILPHSLARHNYFKYWNFQKNHRYTHERLKSVTRCLILMKYWELILLWMSQHITFESYPKPGHMYTYCSSWFGICMEDAMVSYCIIVNSQLKDRIFYILLSSIQMLYFLCNFDAIYIHPLVEIDVVYGRLLIVCKNKETSFKRVRFILVVAVKGKWIPKYYNNSFI